jgi:hypothetical protein
MYPDLARSIIVILISPIGPLLTGLNLPRLRRIKSIHDPDNVFIHPQSVPADENLLCLMKSTVKHFRTPARGTGCLEAGSLALISIHETLLRFDRCILA